MNVVVFDENKTSSPPPPARPDVFLRLVPSRMGPGRILLVAVDANGKKLPQGNLIEFFPDGTMRFRPGVNPELGFDLHDGGRLRIQRSY